MTTSTPLMTAEELGSLEGDGIPRELNLGKLIEMSPAGSDHGEICVSVITILASFIRSHRLGKAFGSETGFLLSEAPDTVLAPDFAFICRDRVPFLNKQRSFIKGPPDLAVEVTSPRDTVKSAIAKAKRWIEFGVQQVWIINPQQRTVTIFDASGEPAKIHSQTEIIADIAILPGFRLAVRDLFECLDETE